MDLGNVISPLVASYLMDRIGRKLSTVALGPLYIVSWLLALYVPSTWALYTARLMAGLGKGMSYTVIPVYLGEIAGVHIRGTLSSVFCIQLHLGFLIEAVIGPLVSYRSLNAISLVVPVVFFVMVVWIPESPYYLLKRGRKSEAARSLEWYRCEPDVSDELQKMEDNVLKDMENKATFGELFSNRTNVKALMVVITACVSQRAGGISCILAYSSLLLPDPSPIIPKTDYIIMFAVLLVMSNFVGFALVDKIGRKPLLILSETGTAVVTLLFALYFYVGMYTDVSAFVWLPYVCHIAFSLMFGVGIGFIPVVFLGEMFPVNIRSHCSALASITLAFCSFVTNESFLLVSKRFGYHVMFFLFTAINFVCTILAYKYALETKGKTFQEIQDLLKKNI